ncbi:MAG: LacI family DNA-binding transcriptional regulator [Clostridiaceae bacterium]
MAVSIKDVAREAGVSIATVSRVINNVNVVSSNTKKRVDDAIEKLGYSPNIVAQSLKTQRSRSIGILIPDISSQVYPEIVRGAEDVAQMYDYSIILCNSDFDVDKEKKYIKVMKEKMVDGLLYMSSSLDPEILDYIKLLQLKTILVETSEEDKALPSVTIDNRRASYDAVKYLLDKGNKRIAYVGIKKDKRNAWARRFDGYEDALKERGMEVDPELTYYGDLKAQTGYKGINAILEKTKVDAVFCGSDEIAMGVINGLRDNGLRCPEDVDVMGFNDIIEAAIFYPKISTISQPLYDMGSVSMRMLVKMLKNEPLDENHFTLGYQLIERDSVKK